MGLRIPSKTLFMYNYIGIGVDAQVALNFHKTRDSLFYVFSSRIFNKVGNIETGEKHAQVFPFQILYLCFGTQQVVTSDCKNLEQKLELYLDGKQVDLPELESIVILNISSWGAGVNLWGKSVFVLMENLERSIAGMLGHSFGKPSQSYHDGILEVLGIYSSFHIAQLQVGLSTPLKLGQARTVEVVFVSVGVRV